ncbi:MAG: methylated-DNA--[Alphaproteobacteria bacterium]|nr:methylated-DNA--[protein]-cysteine S-methyltransferase [Alphaproteobacteria bacterium]
MTEYIHHYQSPLGILTVSSNGDALTGLWFEGQKYFADTVDFEKAKAKNLPVFALCDQWLDIYFSGRAPDFMPPVSFSSTPFRKAVWRILLSIPFGTVVTYGQIADRLAKMKGLNNMSAQAVGAAVGHNPISIIVPCHRVVGANGALTGYAAGIDKKATLLALEGIRIS